MAHLDRAAAGDEASPFHLQAGIASCHCLASRYEETDWARILSLYDLLVTTDASPVVALNRAVAVGKVRGGAAGLATLNDIRNQEALQRYHLFYAVRAELLAELGRNEEARRDYGRALSCTELVAERNYLLKRLREFDIE
jgi:RNA polymerase sigma-70 factor (ECF subfamily)